MKQKNNIDHKVVSDFGKEWKAFNHQDMDNSLLFSAFDSYFHIFPLNDLLNSEGFDMGCGSGRWAKFVAPNVKKLNCIDPSQNALEQAKKNLAEYDNCYTECAGVDDNSINNESQDFGYCLGVLHHIPDTALALKSCSAKLKKGAPFLLYLYYRFDNKPKFYKALFHISNFFRLIICKLPFFLKFPISQLIAIFIYFPLSRFALICENLGINVSNFPLSWYRNESFYILRTDAHDKFATRLEQRFTKAEITQMMLEAGFTDLTFSERVPFWTVLGYKE